MKTLLKVSVLALSMSSLFAVPRFAMMEEVSCGSCHSYQGGGAGRTSYGSEYGRESLVMRDFSLPWEREDSESILSVGLDTRYQMIAEADEDLRQFPMQFALYGGVEVGNLIGHAQVNRISDEFRFTGGLRFEGLPMESWISVAKAIPALGWRVDDHSVFTRGGNLTLQGLSREGMPFTPFLEAPGLVSVGSAPFAGLEMSLMAGSPFIMEGFVGDSKLFTAAKASYLFSGDIFSAHLGLGYLDENGVVHGSVATWGMHSSGVVYLGEWSQLSGWRQQGEDNAAAMHQLSYRILQGIELVGRYEFFDPNTDLTTGAIQRTSLGIEFFPVRGLEVKLSYRTAKLDMPSESTESVSQVLSQIHFHL